MLKTLYIGFLNQKHTLQVPTNDSRIIKETID